MLNKNDRWSALSLKDRADLMNMYITNGISDLKEMKKHYNSFGDGGDILHYDDTYIEPATVTATREPSLVDKIFNYELYKAIFEENKKDSKKDKNTLKEDNKPKSVLGIDRFIHNPIIKEDISRLYSNLDTNKIRINNIFSGEENQDNTVYYYDDTPIEAPVVKAFNSEEEYNKYYGKRFGKKVAKRTNNIAQSVYEGLKYTPLIGDVLDAETAAVDAYNGNYKEALALAGMALLPNIIKKPIKSIKKGIKNVLTYKKYASQPERLRRSVDEIVDRYTKNANLLNSNYGGTDAKRVLNTKEDLINANKNLSITTNYIPFSRKKGGKYNGDIWINPYGKGRLKKAWKSPIEAIKDLHGTAAHEGTHFALYNLNDKLTIYDKSRKYPKANPNHPLYQDVGYIFDDLNREATAWERSPEEFIAELNKFRVNNNIPNHLGYNQWKQIQKRKAQRAMANRFKLRPKDASYIAPEDIDYILSKYANFGYKNGGKLSTKILATGGPQNSITNNNDGFMYKKEESFDSKITPEVPMQPLYYFNEDTQKNELINADDFEDITFKIQDGELDLYSERQQKNILGFVRKNYSKDYNFYKDINSNKIYALSTKVAPAGIINSNNFEHLAYKDIKRLLPRRDYIGGNKRNVGVQIIDKLPGIKDYIKIKAEEYGVNPNNVFHRMVHEGFISNIAKRYNIASVARQKRWNWQDFIDNEVAGYTEFGLDTYMDHVKRGTIIPKKNMSLVETADTNEDGTGNVYHSAIFENLYDAIEAMTSFMEYLTKLGKQENLVGDDLKTFVNGAYNMGENRKTRLRDKKYMKRYEFEDYY